MNILKLLIKDKLTRIGMIILLIYILVALFAPLIAPFDPNTKLKIAGKLVRLSPPSGTFLLGTTDMGRDVFSQLIMGSRVALLVGVIAAVLVTFIGTNIGLLSGYYGGIIDSIIMRIVDIIYGIPFIPFVILMVSLLKPSVWNIVFAMSLLSWRSTARIVRSQVLTLKQRPYIKAARVAGAGDLRIMYKHILPNIIPLVFVELSFLVGWAIISEASISFIGLGDPAVASWGKMLNAAFLAGAVRNAPWWVIPPGLVIIFLVLSVFFISRGLEEVVIPRLKKR